MTSRREFITLLGGVAVSWPASARAQQQAMPVIGWLGTAFLAEWGDLIAAFHQGLKEAGFVEGRNVAIEMRWAEGDDTRLPAMAADLVRQKVTVIYTSGGHQSALAAKAATTTIPIVFLSGNDPIEFGLVTSLSRPTGNMTGVSMVSSALGPKQLGLLRDLIPKAVTVALIANPNNPNTRLLADGLQAAARALGIQLHVLTAGTERDLDAAFATLVERRVEGVIVANDSYLRSRTGQFVALVARHAIPAIYPYRQFAAAGGLLSYGTSLTGQNREAGIYVGRVLNGAKPAELPILQPTTFELVINLKTAQALGLTIPPGVLAIADEVIE